MKTKVKINIKAHHIQLFGNIMYTVADAAHPSNLEAMVLAEYYDKIRAKLFIAMADNKDIKLNFSYSEAIAVYTIMRDNIVLNNNNKPYHAMVRMVVSALDKELTNSNAHPGHLKTPNTLQT